MKQHFIVENFDVVILVLGAMYVVNKTPYDAWTAENRVYTALLLAILCVLIRISDKLDKGDAQ